MLLNCTVNFMSLSKVGKIDNKENNKKTMISRKRTNSEIVIQTKDNLRM